MNARHAGYARSRLAPFAKQRLEGIQQQHAFEFRVQSEHLQ